MKPRDFLALVSPICSVAATAIIPSPSSATNSPEHTAHGTVINHSDPDPDPLWTKYGLNKSEEYKYFQEPGNNEILAHYDSRFFQNPVPSEERSQTLTQMVRAYFNYFKENDLETWIAHGTLLGWWWNGKIMPWDWDIDTQVSETTLLRLADDFNQTVVRIEATDPDLQHSYLLDVNPWARQRDRGKGLNIIDARWIDMRTGLYIDITGLSRLDSEKPNQFQCKNNHKYQIDDIYPLRKTTFQGVSARVPFRYESVLTDEYSPAALTVTHYHEHTWDALREEWISDAVIEAEEEDEDEYDAEEADDDRQYE